MPIFQIHSTLHCNYCIIMVDDKLSMCHCVRKGFVLEENPSIYPLRWNVTYTASGGGFTMVAESLKTIPSCSDGRNSSNTTFNLPFDVQ